jgi:protein SCO1/2
MPVARRRSAALASALLAGTLLTGCAAGTPTASAVPQPAPTPAAAFHGEEPVPMQARPSFVLRTTQGETYDFAERTAGRPTLLYFGYTSCPDECPTAMADIAAAVRSVPAELQEQVEVVFVTTDPDRDTPEVLRRWLDGFSTDVVGLLGSQAEVDAAQLALDVPPAEKAGPVPTLPGKPDEHEHEPGTVPHTHDGPLGYGVGHANVIFAFDSTDRLPVLYREGVRPADLAADLPLLAQGATS